MDFFESPTKTKANHDLGEGTSGQQDLEKLQFREKITYCKWRIRYGKLTCGGYKINDGKMTQMSSLRYM